jgi:uncharacterized protein
MIKQSMQMLTLAAGLAVGLTAQAAQFGIGTSGQGTATYGIGSAIASVVANDTGDQYVVQPYGGTGKIVPLVETGRVDFSLANILEVTTAYKGVGAFKDRPNPNLRVVAVVYPFEVGLFVKKDSPAQTVNDIKGLRISSEYSGQRIIGTLVNAVLANANLSMADMQAVPVANIIGNADDFAAGKVDVGFFAVGAGKVSEVDASVGGIRFLAVNRDADAEKRMQAVVPQSYVTMTKPRADLAGVVAETSLMAYDYLLYAGAHVSDDAIERLLAAMIKNRDALASNYPSLGGMDPQTMHKKLAIPYHPGAEKFYRAQGLWKN